MDGWRERVDDLLYDGESTVESVAVGGSRAVVTTHRLLAFAPDRDPRFQEVARPNVTGVTVETSGATGWLRRAARAGAWGVGLLVASALASFDGALSAPRGDVMDALAFLRVLFAALALLDDALRVAGAVLLLAAVAFLGRYLRSRERAVVVAVSGGDDVRLPAADADGAAAALRDALRPE